MTNLIEATKQMREIQNEYVANCSEKTTREREAIKLKKEIEEAVIGLGKALKLLNDRLLEEESEIKDLQEVILEHNSDFYREFGVYHYQVDWAFHPQKNDKTK